MPHNNADDREQFVEDVLIETIQRYQRLRFTRQGVSEAIGNVIPEAKQQLLDRFAQVEREAVDNARAKDPFECEFGHKVYGHTTSYGWCCACEADQAFLEAEIEKRVTDRLAKLTKQEGEI